MPIHWITYSGIAHQYGSSKIILVMTSGELGELEEAAYKGDCFLKSSFPTKYLGIFNLFSYSGDLMLWTSYIQFVFVISLWKYRSARFTQGWCQFKEMVSFLLTFEVCRNGKPNLGVSS